MTQSNDTESRASFEAWVVACRDAGKPVPNQHLAWLGWQACEAELATLREQYDALIAVHEDSLTKANQRRTLASIASTTCHEDGGQCGVGGYCTDCHLIQLG